MQPSFLEFPADPFTVIPFDGNTETVILHDSFPASPIIPPHCFNISDEAPPSLEVSLQTVLLDCIKGSESSTTQVFRSQSWLVNLSDGETVPGVFRYETVCKVAYGSRPIKKLEREAGVYKRLSELQGKAVPLAYGYFNGPGRRGDVAVLVLEDCGRSLPRSLNLCPPQVRVDAVHAIIDIHKMGVEHNDIDNEDNIVVKKYPSGHIKTTIVDFGNASPHRCRSSGEKYALYERIPQANLIGCYEIAVVYGMADMYDPRFIRWGGKTVPAGSDTTPECVVATYGQPEGSTGEDAEAKARDELEEMDTRWAARIRYDKWITATPFPI